MRTVGDSDGIRRANRALLLAALRRAGPLPRTQLAAETGLSPASVTVIVQDMVAQGILTDLREESRGDARVRGRPAIRVGFSRGAATVCLVEIDVSRIRLSLVDYGGTLIDRIEKTVSPATLTETPPHHILRERIEALRSRNPSEFEALRRIAISVQGVLDRDGATLLWSPVTGLARVPLAYEIGAAFSVPVALIKRGGLLAEGTRWLNPHLRDARIATVFVGSTVSMGIAAPGSAGSDFEGATEFGHMNHAPNGALCRCGMRGCIEAYASDYGILRAAYSVPETTAPAPAVPAAEYDGIIQRALHGNRNAVHAFNLAGRAIGYGLARLTALFEPSHVFLVGPGTRAFSLLEPEIQAALGASFVAGIHGVPLVQPMHDESEPIFQGLMMRTLDSLDQAEFAAMPALAARA